MKIARAVCAMLACGAVAYGCSAAGGGNGLGDTAGTLPPLSPACQSFDQAFCAYDAKCYPTDTGCNQDLLFCTSDAAAQSCTGALGSAPCGSPVAACQNTIDPQPAVNFCDQFAQEYCADALTCGDAGGTLQDCITVAEGTSGANCPAAIAVEKSAQQCLSNLKGAGCSVTVSMPPSCKGVILTSGTGADAGAAAPLVWLNGVPLAGLRRARRFVSWSVY